MNREWDIAENVLHWSPRERKMTKQEEECKGITGEALIEFTMEV
jgi:hypothetical protein